MIDLKDLRERPDRYRTGVINKNGDVALVERLLDADEQLRALQTRSEALTAEKNRIGKEIGALAGQLKRDEGAYRQALPNTAQQTTLAQVTAKTRQQLGDRQQRATELKAEQAALADDLAALQKTRDELWLLVPQPADDDVPVGRSADDNVELRRWSPAWFDTAKSFEQNKGFKPLTHLELGAKLGLFDFERGVKISGSRSYVLTGDGMRLHQAVLRFAFDFMVNEHGFTPLSVADLVRHETMVGTGFFPHGRDQVYDIANPTGDYGLALTGTGEVGLMAYHADEVLDEATLPRRYVTVSTCFRREAGAAGKDTAGLYRIHQFDKVEQVVLCRADEQESRQWHRTMIGFVETLLQRLEIPYRLLQCCTGDLGPKNADMIDLESWMPSRGEGGAYGETHSASRLYDYQCRRLNIRYKPAGGKQTTTCHSLNNTVAASPRILIPILELYQNADGTVTVPAALRPHLGGQEIIGGR